jgi:hypothetical protein
MLMVVFIIKLFLKINFLDLFYLWYFWGYFYLQTEEIYFSDYGHMNGEGEYYDEHSTLYTRLLKAEEVRLSYRL